MPAAVAAATIARTTIAAAAAGEEAGFRRLLAANQGDAHEGKKRCHTEYNNAVHPRILQLLTGTVSRKPPKICRQLRLIKEARRREHPGCDSWTLRAAPTLAATNPVGKICRLRNL
jgi:hypothetical protein